MISYGLALELNRHRFIKWLKNAFSSSAAFDPNAEIKALTASDSEEQKEESEKEQAQ